MAKRRRMHVAEVCETTGQTNILLDGDLRSTSLLKICNSHVTEIVSLNQPISESGCTVPEIGEDGVLCSILSDLTIRDAVRTSILSSRWKNLWKCIPNLNFDVHNMFEVDPIDNSFSHLSLEEQKAIIRTAMNKFIRSVDGFLHHHQGTGVKLFKVEFHLRKEHEEHLVRWLRFAIQSGARDIIICLWKSKVGRSLDKEPCDFPHQLFTGQGGSSVEFLHLIYCNFRLPPYFVGFRALRKLLLECLFIADKDIENVLSLCPTIEWLAIHCCPYVVNLVVSQPSGRMKFLSVRFCMKLAKIEFNAIVLTKFDYLGLMVMFTLKNASRVKELWLSIDTIVPLKWGFTELHNSFGQPETLCLYNVTAIWVQIIPSSCKFTHLKHLQIGSALVSKNDFLRLASLVNAAPFLTKFELHLKGGQAEDDPEILVLPEDYPGSTTNPSECVHNHLRQLKIGGFIGVQVEIEFVRNVVRSAIVLESITLDPYYSNKYFNGEWFRMERADAPPPELCRERAYKYLCGNIRAGVRMVIL